MDHLTEQSQQLARATLAHYLCHQSSPEGGEEEKGRIEKAARNIRAAFEALEGVGATHLDEHELKLRKLAAETARAELIAGGK